MKRKPLFDVIYNFLERFLWIWHFFMFMQIYMREYTLNISTCFGCIWTNIYLHIDTKHDEKLIISGGNASRLKLANGLR